jgi:putative transposase
MPWSRNCARSSSERDPEEGCGVFRPGGARPPIEVIVGFVDDHRDEFGVEPICTTLQVAPSTYHAAKRRQLAPSARAVRDAAMMQVLMVLWVANR